MTRDIAERLRDYGAKYSQIDLEYLMCIEATNEIERLRAELAWYREAMQSIGGVVNEFRAHEKAGE